MHIRKDVFITKKNLSVVGSLQKMDKVESFFGTLTPLQRAINRATEKKEADWQLNLDIIDEINRGGEKK